MTSVVVKSVDEGRVRRAVDEYAARLLSTRPDIEEIVVFGSFERGTWAPGSDLDVFVVLRQSDRAIPDRIADLLPGAFPVGPDLFPYPGTRWPRARLHRCSMPSGAVAGVTGGDAWRLDHRRCDRPRLDGTRRPA